jgi:hypothetical protein
LYRHHLIHQCERCKELFDSAQEVRVHLSGTPGVEGCASKIAPQIDGITGWIKEQLHSRKKAFPGQTPAQQWEQIYRLLFPGEEVPDPCQLSLFTPSRLVFLSAKANHSLDFEPVRDIDDLTRYQEYIHRELPRFFREVVNSAVTGNHLPLEEETRNQMMALLPEALNRAFSSFSATLDQIPSALIRDETPLDISTLRTMQQPIQESSGPTLFSDSEYRSHDSHSGILSRDTENNGNSFNEGHEQRNPADMRATRNIPLPEMDPFQPTQSEVDITQHRLSLGGRNDMASGTDDLLIDSQPFLADSWLTILDWDEWNARS